jgi:esterase/lipase superfamily enzyme
LQKLAFSPAKNIYANRRSLAWNIMVKPIRFFATNRDRKNLGRDINRDKRITLQEGGYHWVDMKKYMAYYLATTDRSNMPSQSIIQNSDKTIFDEFLLKKSVKRIIIGIHGFNVSFEAALTSFSLLADCLSPALKKFGSTLITDPDDPITKPVSDDPNHDVTAFVGFSWPSNGKVLEYLSDRAEAVQTSPILSNLIGYIRTKNPTAEVHIIAHSMGNYLTCNMLSGLIDKVFKPFSEGNNADIEKQLKRQDQGGENAFFIDRFFMLAPDVERREVTQCDDDDDPKDPKSQYLGPFHAGLKHLVQETHLFYSRFDSALKVSVVEKDFVQESFQKGVELFTGTDLKKRWESSLGLNPLSSLVPENMYDHNATVLTNRAIDHGDYFDAPAIIEKIAAIIMKKDKISSP